MFKGLGVKAGVPDLILIHDGRTYGLELKADGSGVTPGTDSGTRLKCGLLAQWSRSRPA